MNESTEPLPMNEPTEPLPVTPGAGETPASVAARPSACPPWEATTVGGDEAVGPAAPTERRFGHYELGRELGRGGMGVVHEARHVGLNRKVALKMIRAGPSAGGECLKRFRIEADAMATLDHPGIVPVYEVGEAEGWVYLAMKLAPGGSLADRLDRYRDAPRAAAELAAEVADAIQHAHSRGLLHRDLKPANILIDADGRPLVADFGLAKRFQEDSELTRFGVVLGTPAYTSPEQAEGRDGALTTAADVYGLGAILYTMLAGRPPFGGDGATNVLQAVRSLPPTPPSRINPRVPRDLETIVLKCLEKEPRRRYATADALALDLRAWLDARPIAARRVGVVERCWFYCRRRPATAALAAAVAVASLGGTTAVLVVQARANAELRESNARERRQFDLAVDAIRGVRQRVADDPLLKDPRFAPLRAALLREAADFYGRLEAMLKGRDDPASLATLAGAYYELGELTEQTGSKVDALAMHKKALAIRRAAAATPVGDGERALDLARSLIAVAKLDAALGDAEESDAELREAAGLAGAVAGEDALNARAWALEEIARVGVLASRTDQARAAFAEALAIRERAVANAPDAVRPRERLAALATTYGEFELLMRRPDAAAALFDRADAVLAELARSNPADVGALESRADVLMKRATLDGHFLGRPREALLELEEARRLLSGLLAEQPALVAPRLLLAECRFWRFLAFWGLGLMDRALQAADDLAATAEELLRNDARATAHRAEAATGLTARALVLSRTGRHAEALPLFERAAREFDAVVQAAPSLPSWRFMDVAALVNLANELRRLGRSREALSVCRRASAVAEETRRGRASLTLVQMHRGEVFRQLAEVRVALGEPAAAAAAARDAAALLSDPPPQALQDYYEQAAALAVLAGLARTPGSGVAADEGPPAALAAVAALGTVRDMGFRNVAVVASETAFDSLRDRDDFRAIIADMVFAGDVFAPPPSP